MKANPASTTWRTRAKAAVAGAVVAALAVFGGMTAASPEPPADEQAGGTWSFFEGPSDGFGKGGPGAGTNGATWS